MSADYGPDQAEEDYRKVRYALNPFQDIRAVEALDRLFNRIGVLEKTISKEETHR